MDGKRGRRRDDRARGEGVGGGEGGGGGGGGSVNNSAKWAALSVDPCPGNLPGRLYVTISVLLCINKATNITVNASSRAMPTQCLYKT